MDKPRSSTIDAVQEQLVDFSATITGVNDRTLASACS